MPKKSSNDECISPKEAARKLNVSVFSIYNWIKNPSWAPGFPGKKISKRCIRIPRDEFNLWLKAK